MVGGERGAKVSAIIPPRCDPLPDVGRRTPRACLLDWQIQGISRRGTSLIQDPRQHVTLLRGNPWEHEPTLVAEKPALGALLGAYDLAPHDLGRENERPKSGRKLQGTVVSWA